MASSTSRAIRIFPLWADLERPSVIAGQTLLVAALIVLPLLYTLVPPLEDYPNHLTRIFALANLHGNSILSRFYEVEWSPIPNLIMDLVAPPLVPLVGIYAAGRIFLALALLLMLTGPLALHRAVHGRWSAWPLVGGLFVYNGFLFTGLMNYLFGVGLAVWGTAVWIMLSERPTMYRIAASLAFCAALYVCHLSALGLYGLAIGAYEAWRLGASRRLDGRSVALGFTALVLPALPFLWLLVQSPTWSLAPAFAWEAQGKLEAITMFLTVYSDLSDIPLLILAGAAVYFGVRRGVVHFHPAGLLVLIVLSCAFLAMPRLAFGSWMADQRLVVGIFFITLGFASVDLRGLGISNLFFALCLASIAFRVVDVSVNWAATSQSLLELRDTVRRMPFGSRLLVTQSDDPATATAVGAALAHAPTLAVIERSALVSRLFVVPGKQVLHARLGFREHVDTQDGDTPTVSRVMAAASESAPEGPNYWDRWSRNYDYLIVLGTDPDESANPAPDRLRIVHNGRAFQLYAIYAVRPAS
jgi:hypothetical protein